MNVEQIAFELARAQVRLRGCIQDRKRTIGAYQRDAKTTSWPHLMRVERDEQQATIERDHWMDALTAHVLEFTHEPGGCVACTKEQMK